MAENKDINKEVELNNEGACGASANDNVNAAEEKVNAGAGEDVKAEGDAAGVSGADADGNASDAAGEMSEQEQMAKRVEDAEQKAAEATDKYVRMAAEFDNYRRRTAKERIELISTAGEDVIKGLLPILDDCERALQVLKQSNDSAAAIEGTELIYNKLMTFLKGRGLSAIEAKGKDLDTEFHEAVAQFPVQDSDMKNKIIDVVQQGYLLNGKVIRYAKVVVGM